MNNSFDFKNKNILIGGSTNGIGWASAQLFSKNGAGTLNCRTDESYVKKLLSYFKKRG